MMPSSEASRSATAPRAAVTVRGVRRDGRPACLVQTSGACSQIRYRVANPLPGGNATVASVAAVKTSGVTTGKSRGNSSIHAAIAPGATHAQGSGKATGRNPRSEEHAIMSDKKTRGPTLNKTTMRDLTPGQLNCVTGGRFPGYYYQPRLS